MIVNPFLATGGTQVSTTISIFASMSTHKKSVYVETTIPSLVTARTSRDLITAYRQDISKLFWENERSKYDLFISQYVFAYGLRKNGG